MNRRLELGFKRFVFVMIIYIGIVFTQSFNSIIKGWIVPGIIFMISIFVFDYWFVLKERKVGERRT